MAAKKAKAKAKPTTKRPTAAKGKPAAKGKAAAKGEAAAKAKAAPKAKAKAKTSPKAPRAKTKATPKQTARPTKQPSLNTVAVAAPPKPQMELFPIADDVAPTKKGPFARLAGGVGSLIARMTGKKASEPEQPPVSSPDATIALTTSDIMLETAVPPPVPKPKR